MATDPEAARRRLALQKSFSIERGESWRKRSLIEDAKFDTVTNAEFEKQERKASSSSNQDDTFAEDDIFPVTNGDVTNAEAGDDVHHACSFILTSKDLATLSYVFKHLEKSQIQLQHLESRKSKKKGWQLELIVQIEGTRDEILTLVKCLRQCSTIQDLQLLKISGSKCKAPWIPHHISDLDRCTHLLTKFNPDLDYQHPGFADKVYRARRTEIADIAFSYKYGDPIPRIDYTSEEIQTWGQVYRQLRSLFDQYACKEHIRVFNILEREGGYSEHFIPQLDNVSRFLKRWSGFQLRPVAGLLSARDFLASLAFRVFQCTQYIRHSSSPDHTVEPDCVHELLGHVPMLADPGFAQFSQEIGLATLGASDEDIEKFATLYWFTVEFGLCRQDGQIRAYGAGLLSAYGELKYSLSDKPERRPFDPQTTALQKYDDQDYQKVYFVTESFDSMKDMVRQYASTIKRPYDVRYDPYTENIQVLDNKEVIQDISRVLKGDVNCLNNALNKIEHLTII